MLRLTTAFIFLLALQSAGAAQDAVTTGRHLFILSGQSNMRKPLPGAFRRAVAQVFGEDRVIVVTHAHPSQPIRRWYKKWVPPEGMEDDGQPNGQLYDALMTRVNQAIANKRIATVTFIWMQGEADAHKGWGAVYEQSFLGVLDQLKQDLKRDQVNFVIGRINDFWLPENGAKDGVVVRDIQKKLGEAHANGDWVDTDDLNMGVNPWGGYSIADGHFPPAGYVALGKRFARKACQLIDPDITLDERVFAEAFMDTANDIKTHAAIGKSLSGTTSDPTHKSGTTLAALTDGKFGGTDPTDRAWLAVAPKSGEAQWVIDLEHEQDITAVAVSILINRSFKAGFPTRMGFAVSTDGQKYIDLVRRRNRTWVSFGDRDAHRLAWNQKLKPQSVLVLVNKNIKARYIRITATTSESWLFVDEIAVNPVAK